MDSTLKTEERNRTEEERNLLERMKEVANVLEKYLRKEKEEKLDYQDKEEIKEACENLARRIKGQREYTRNLAGLGGW